MAQPVPVSRQWLIKLVIAIFGGLICVLALLALRIDSPFYILILSFAGFWCASAFSGTWRSSLWVLPVLYVLTLASRFGDMLGNWATAGPLMASLVARFHPLPFAGAVLNTAVDSRVVAVWLVVPTLLLALVQSYRLFRTEPPNSIRFLGRLLLPLVVVTFLCGFSLRVFGDFVVLTAEELTLEEVFVATLKS